MRREVIEKLKEEIGSDGVFLFKEHVCRMDGSYAVCVDTGIEMGVASHVYESMIHNVRAGRRVLVARKIFIDMLLRRMGKIRVVDFRANGHYDLAKAVREIFIDSIKIDCDIIFENGYFWIVPLWKGDFSQDMSPCRKEKILKHRREFGIWDFNEETLSLIKIEFGI
jgi:hypothetical protein